jgi:thiol-disulfide isomerase/thioredoxin
MKMIQFAKLFLLLSLIGLAFCACDKKTEAPAAAQVEAPGGLIGQAAPELELKDVSGQTQLLSQYRGQVVILNFWATWCPPCREEMPSMDALQRKFGEQGLVVLAVNVEENEAAAVSAFLENNAYSFPILLDPEAVAQNAYGVYRFPESFILDRNGVIVDKVIGSRDWMSGSIYKQIDFLLNG